MTKLQNGKHLEALFPVRLKHGRVLHHGTEEVSVL